MRLLAGAEAAFRDALLESFDGLELCDRNLLRFHYFHGLGVDQLAEMFSSHRASLLRQLARIRERVLRDTRRGLAARLPLDKHQLDRLLDVARARFDLAIARVLRS
jgi:RNA polymerase sigma-70 factor